MQISKPKSGPGRLLGLFGLGLAMILGLTLPGFAPARAAELDDVVTNVQLREESVGRWDVVHVDIDWRLPSVAAPGDTFWVQLPPELVALDGMTFPLQDAQGRLVADALVVGDTITFTLTEYVATYQNVRGTASLGMEIVSTVERGVPVTLRFTTSTTTYTDSFVVGPPPAKQPSLYKWGNVVTNPTDDAPGRLLFGILGPYVTQEMVDSGLPIVFQDDGGQGYTFNCGPTNPRFYLRNSEGATTTTLPLATPGDPDAAAAIGVEFAACTENSVTVKYIPRASDIGLIPEIRIDAGWTDLNQTTFVNEATVTVQEQGPTSTSWTVQRTTGAGEASGDLINITKFTGDDPVAGDHDEAPGFRAELDATTPVTMTVTNTGSTVLSDVVVTDTTVAGPAMENLSCSFPDGSTGTTWSGPFEVGASFDCTGVIPALNGGVQHTDVISVAAVGNGPVKDDNPFNAIGPDVPRTPTPTPTPTPSAETPPPPSTQPTPTPSATTPSATTPPSTPTRPGELPRTGVVEGSAGIAMGGLLIASAVGVLLRRRLRG